MCGEGEGIKGFLMKRVIEDHSEFSYPDAVLIKDVVFVESLKNSVVILASALLGA